MTDPVLNPVPEPVVRAAAVWGTLSALIVTVIGVLVALGVLSSEQAYALNEAVTAVNVNLVPVGIALVGIVGLVSGIAAHLVTAFVARRHVTPVPRAKR